MALAVNVLQWLQGRALGRQISKQEKLLTQIAHREAPETAAAIGEQLQPEAFMLVMLGRLITDRMRRRDYLDGRLSFHPMPDREESPDYPRVVE